MIKLLISNEDGTPLDESQIQLIMKTLELRLDLSPNRNLPKIGEIPIISTIGSLVDKIREKPTPKEGDGFGDTIGELKRVGINDQGQLVLIIDQDDPLSSALVEGVVSIIGSAPVGGISPIGGVLAAAWAIKEGFNVARENDPLKLEAVVSTLGQINGIKYIDSIEEAESPPSNPNTIVIRYNPEELFTRRQ